MQHKKAEYFEMLEKFIDEYKDAYWSQYTAYLPVA